MLPHLGKVMGAANRVEDMGGEGNRLLGKILPKLGNNPHTPLLSLVR
jgi:hypothetical protein